LALCDHANDEVGFVSLERGVHFRADDQTSKTKKKVLIMAMQLFEGDHIDVQLRNVHLLPVHLPSLILDAPLVYMLHLPS